MSLEIHAVSTTVSCTVSSDEGHLSAETDGRAWGWNGGRSQYFAGDSCFVLVYKSDNVDIIGSYCSSNSTTFTYFQEDTALNIHREGIAFSSPLATAQKPLPSSVTVISRNFSKCGTPEYLIGGVTLRLKDWQATGQMDGIPPHGFVFIEYTPKTEVWVFRGLVPFPNLLNTPVHGTLHGLVTAPSTVDFVGL